MVVIQGGEDVSSIRRPEEQVMVIQGVRAEEHRKIHRLLEGGAVC